MATKIKILLVEDDKKFAESLEKLFIHEGYECTSVDKPNTALSLIKLHNFDVALIDCMLPQMNGVDLAVKIRESTPVPIQIHLMSGIYKDRNFSINALKKTNAKSFFIKPFDISTFITAINDEFSAKKHENLPEALVTIKSLYTIENLTQNSILTSLAAQKNIFGFEIPFLIHLLLFYKYKGRLNLSSDQSRLSVYINDGQLILEPSEASPHQIRALLLEENTLPESDAASLTESHFNEAYLTENNYVSPHHFKKIHQTIAIQNLNNFVATKEIAAELIPNELNKSGLPLSVHEVDSLLYSWCMNIPLQDLKNYHKDFSQFGFKKLNTHQNKTLHLPLISAHKAIINHLLEGKNLQEVLSSQLGSEDSVYRCIHILLTHREFSINTKIKQNTKAHLAKLKALQETMKEQTFFSRLGLPDTANDTEVKKAFQTLSQNFHPDKLQSESDEIKDNSQVIYELIQEAYRGLKTIEERENYLEKLTQEKQNNIFMIDNQADQAIQYLMKNDFQNAEPLLNAIEQMKMTTNKVKMVQIWFYTKTKKQPIQTVSRILQSINSEEKESALFYFVKGLIHVSQRENDKAYTAFKNCLAKDPNFLPARREMAPIAPEEKKEKSILKADLKDVVGLFFKKRS